MNKRLLAIYTIVFILTGIMLYLYRVSYTQMKIYIHDVNAVGNVLIRLERLNALVHFWLEAGSTTYVGADGDIPADVAFDSVINTISALQGMVLYQEQRLRLDSIRRVVKEYQRISETDADTTDSRVFRQHLQSLDRLTKNAYTFSKIKLTQRKEKLEESTALLDKWLGWMLILAGSLITVATFYSFYFFYQRRVTEDFNQRLLETTNNGIVSFSPEISNHIITDYKVTYCNDAALRLLNLQNWNSQTLKTIVDQRIYEDLRRLFDQVQLKKVSRTTEGYLDSAGSRNWLKASLAPIENGVLVSVYDLTPVKRYEQKLTYKIRQLELVNEELQQYAYITSHDLQEPLRKIQMFTDIGISTPQTEPERKDALFHKIVRTANHMRELIQALLTFTRITHSPGEFSAVNLNEVLSEVISEFDVAITDVGAQVSVSCLPVVEGSKIHLVLLFSNLVGNSLKFSRTDVNPIIDIDAQAAGQAEYERFKELDPLATYTRITINDNGVGFAPEHSEKIFTIFQRLNNKENVSGSGIGLAVCRKIVHQHHGFIYADAEENRGTVFTIFLPFRQTESG